VLQDIIEPSIAAGNQQVALGAAIAETRRNKSRCEALDPTISEGRGYIPGFSSLGSCPLLGCTANKRGRVPGKSGKIDTKVSKQALFG